MGRRELCFRMCGRCERRNDCKERSAGSHGAERLSAELSWIPLCRGALLKSFEEGSKVLRAILYPYIWVGVIGGIVFGKRSCFPLINFDQSGFTKSHRN